MPDAIKPRYAPGPVNYLARTTALVLGKLFWGIRYHGIENIPPKDAFPYIIASNHQAYFDPGWIGAKIPQKMAFMAWGEAFEWKLVGPMIRYLGAFPVSLEGGAKSLSSIKAALRMLKDGAALIVFPEGERAFADGELLRFKNGVARIAMQARVPVLPVTISGGNRVWPQKQALPRFFRRVDVTYHPLIQPPAEDLKDGDVYMTRLIKEAIESGL